MSKRRGQGVPRDLPGCWSQTQYSASRVNHATPGHTYCKCGLALLGASDDVKKQVLKNIINFFRKLTTSAFVFEQVRPRRKTFGRNEDSQLYDKARDHFYSAVKKQYKSIFDRYQEDERYRQNLQSQGKTEENVKERDRLTEGPKREHVATTAERDQWSNT